MNRLQAATLLAVLCVGGCYPEPSDDDAGDLSFMRQAVPELLGRNLRNAHEQRLLLDLEDLFGREVVLEMLSHEPEFYGHWTHKLADQLAVQRQDVRTHPAACYDQPLRFDDGTPDSGALAAFIRGNPLTVGYTPPVETNPGVTFKAVPAARGRAPSDKVAVPPSPFNMVDVMMSSFALDDLSVTYQAHMLPLGIFDGSGGQSRVGAAFLRDYLNRTADCSSCHNSSYSTSSISPFPIDLDTAVLGCTACSATNLDPLFRQDVTADELDGDDPALADLVHPWGITEDCGSLLPNYQGAVDMGWPGIEGSEEGTASLPHLVEQFRQGVASIRAQGLQFQPGSGDLPTLPSDQALAYMVAASAVEEVWRDLLGSPLTAAHHYARNEDQMQMHRYLTERFLASDWSLRDLIVTIMQTGYFNRRSPASTEASTAYELYSLFDPFVATPGCSGNCDNGVGDIVHRRPPHQLVSKVAGALGWPEPRRYPGGFYPSRTMMQDMQAYRSDSAPGHRDWGFQSLLAWEWHTADCEKPAGLGSDWIDALMSEVAAHDAAHPDQPAQLRDVVIALKDRLLQSGRIGPLPGPIDQFLAEPLPEPSPGYSWLPPSGLEVQTPDSEVAGLHALFGASLATPAAQVADLEERTRGLCGVLLETATFTLAGLEAPDELVTPRLTACNPGEPCTYRQHCEHYRPTLQALGHPVTCFGPSVAVELPLQVARSSTPPPPARPDVLTSRQSNIEQRMIDGLCNYLRHVSNDAVLRRGMREPVSGRPLTTEQLDRVRRDACNEAAPAARTPASDLKSATPAARPAPTRSPPRKATLSMSTRG